MDSQTIRTALGKLQAEPGSKEAWESLQSSAKQAGGDLSSDELARLLDSAREKHAERGEWTAAAKLPSDHDVLMLVYTGLAGAYATP
jgi:hypothetical protein